MRRCALHGRYGCANYECQRIETQRDTIEPDDPPTPPMPADDTAGGAFDDEEDR
jgi:hypothetical protein